MSAKGHKGAIVLVLDFDVFHCVVLWLQQCVCILMAAFQLINQLLCKLNLLLLL